MYGGEFRLSINPIVASIRKTEIDQVKYVQYLRSDEVLQFLTEIGEPTEGFGKKVVFESGRVAKSELLRKIPALDAPTYRNQTAKVVSFYREMDINKASRVRWLRNNEILAFLKALGEPITP